MAKKASLTTLAVILGAGLSTTSGQQVRYRLTPLGAFPGGLVVSNANALNDLGQVTGFADNSTGGGSGFRWDAATGMIALGALPGANSGGEGWGINNSGHVGGASSSANGPQAFIWTPEYGSIGIGDLSGGSFASYAWDINDLDQVTGYSRSDAGNEAFFWDPEQGMIGLGDFPGGNFFSQGFAINNSSQVVGSGIAAGSGAGMLRAFLWSSQTGMQALPDFPDGSYAEGAVDINDRGQIVGQAVPVADLSQPFLWDPQAGYTLLGYFPAQPGAIPFTSPRGLNDRGEVVGAASTTFPPTYFAWLWDSRNGRRRLTDLIDPCVPTTGRRIISATRINNHGQISGLRSPNEAVLLTPYLVGDLDDDGDVDLLDLTSLLSNFGRTGNAMYADGDIEACDGDVDLRDLTQLLSNFGESYP